MFHLSFLFIKDCDKKDTPVYKWETDLSAKKQEVQR
jgi:hypothetical protein